jgi:glutathione S-transferase
VRWEKPWEPETIVGDYSPLQQLPILLHGTSEKMAAYDSTYILDYLELMTQSKPWMDRQRKKIETGLAEVAELIGERAPTMDDVISLGDIALGTTLCMFEFEGVGMPILPEFGWRENHPGLGTYYDALIARPSFQKTEPVMFETDLEKTV